MPCEAGRSKNKQKSCEAASFKSVRVPVDYHSEQYRKYERMAQAAVAEHVAIGYAELKAMTSAFGKKARSPACPENDEGIVFCPAASARESGTIGCVTSEATGGYARALRTSSGA